MKFYDANGAITNPASASVTLSYNMRGRATHASYPMVQNDDVWSYEWDSRDADEGAVYGHAQTDGDAPVSSVDFEFRLTANKANKSASGCL